MNELKEKLAAIEHERWADWQGYVFTQCKKEPLHVELTIPADLVRQWRRQIDTPYANLSEEEKQKDRDQVDRYWDLIPHWNSADTPPNTDRLITVETEREGIFHDIARQMYSSATVKAERIWWCYGHRVTRWMEISE